MWFNLLHKGGITGVPGVLGESDNYLRRLIDFNAERGLCVGDTYSSTRIYIIAPQWLQAKLEWR